MLFGEGSFTFRQLFSEESVKKVYLCGPMTGYENHNYDAFDHAAGLLGFHYQVLNPAGSFGGDQGLPRAVYIARGVEQVLEADIVFLLKGWEKSYGARAEVALALELGLPVGELEITGLQWSYGPVLTREDYLSRTGARPVTEAPDKSILSEAQTLVHGDRQASYGHPAKNFGQTAALVTALLEGKLNTPLTAEDIGLIMIAVKLSRETHTPRRDNLVDIAGYAETVRMVRDYQAEDAVHRKVDS